MEYPTQVAPPPAPTPGANSAPKSTKKSGDFYEDIYKLEIRFTDNDVKEKIKPFVYDNNHHTLREFAENNNCYVKFETNKLNNFNLGNTIKELGNYALNAVANNDSCPCLLVIYSNIDVISELQTNFEKLNGTVYPTEQGEKKWREDKWNLMITLHSNPVLQKEELNDITVEKLQAMKTKKYDGYSYLPVVQEHNRIIMAQQKKEEEEFNQHYSVTEDPSPEDPLEYVEPYTNEDILNKIPDLKAIFDAINEINMKEVDITEVCQKNKMKIIANGYKINNNKACYKAGRVSLLSVNEFAQDNDIYAIEQGAVKSILAITPVLDAQIWDEMVTKITTYIINTDSATLRKQGLGHIFYNAVGTYMFALLPPNYRKEIDPDTHVISTGALKWFNDIFKFTLYDTAHWVKVFEQRDNNGKVIELWSDCAAYKIMAFLKQLAFKVSKHYKGIPKQPRGNSAFEQISAFLIQKPSQPEEQQKILIIKECNSKLLFINKGIKSSIERINKGYGFYETLGGKKRPKQPIYVKYNNHKYKVRLLNGRKMILVKKAPVFLNDIRGKYKRVVIETR